MRPEDRPKSVKEAVACSMGTDALAHGDNTHDADDADVCGRDGCGRARRRHVDNVWLYRRSATNARLRWLRRVTRMCDDSLFARLRAPDAISERASYGEKYE